MAPNTQTPQGTSPFCTKFSPTQELGAASCSRAVLRDSGTQGTKNAALQVSGGLPLPLPYLGVSPDRFRSAAPSSTANGQVSLWVLLRGEFSSDLQ